MQPTNTIILLADALKFARIINTNSLNLTQFGTYLSLGLNLALISLGHLGTTCGVSADYGNGQYLSGDEL